MAHDVTVGGVTAFTPTERQKDRVEALLISLNAVKSHKNTSTMGKSCTVQLTVQIDSSDRSYIFTDCNRKEKSMDQQMQFAETTDLQEVKREFAVTVLCQIC